ncbi:MAG: nucleotidyltransferase family protein [Thermodesulfovibrio sp.]|nr:nucleotidyltransferase family protein [Thermodesulfovibrio sp.]
MKLKAEGIKEKLIELKPYLKERYGVKEIGIFGSYVRAKQRKKSDLDILVDFFEDTEITLLDFIEMKHFLSKKLGIKIDLVIKRALKKNIGKTIISEVVYI